MYDLGTIHNSLINGNRTQMASQIKAYGLYDFWADYKAYLEGNYLGCNAILTVFADAVISYHHITSS